MQSGRLRHRVTIQKPSSSATTDAVGEPTTPWVDVLEDYPAEVAPVSTGERHIAAQNRMVITHRVTMRYCAALAAMDGSWRIVFDGRYLPIDGVRNLLENNRVLEVVCVEGLREV